MQHQAFRDLPAVSNKDKSLDFSQTLADPDLMSCPEQKPSVDLGVFITERIRHLSSVSHTLD